ncbi:MAG: hypothetical protein IPG45_34740 [Deltaproteobacteria bacterium]|jgi:O-antigen/teichoic acid export membrane protein|nr:hypothetical protein [Deltaproteobacteria bacterium]
MASLRSNLLISTAAMVLVGLIRPGFNAFVTRAFGAEVNGRAATVVALLFLASLPATAALPTVMVRHVSRSLGEGAKDAARAFAALTYRFATGFAIFGAIGAGIYGHFALSRPLSVLEILVLGAGLFGYTYWRLGRILLLAIGKAFASLWADVASVLVMFLFLVTCWGLGWPTIAVAGVPLVYVAFSLFTAKVVWSEIRGGVVSPQMRTTFHRFHSLLFLGSTSSLAAREVALLLLEAQVDAAVLGELSLSLSLLLALALAPRIIEVPLVHELASLGGGAQIDRQRLLTEKGLHWLSVFSLAAGFGLAIVARPLLSIIGNVSSDVVVLSFSFLTLGFMLEMLMAPVMNFLVAEAPPSVMTVCGLASLSVAGVWWLTPWGRGVLGVMIGLAASFVVKALIAAYYARSRFGLHLLENPIEKVTVSLLGGGFMWMVQTERVPAWAGFLVFELLTVILFRRALRDIFRSVLRRPGPALTSP